jgi:hypothetical protein
LWLDAALTEQVLINLLKNALYYLNDFPNSNVTIGIEKDYEYKGALYNTIYVHDTGPGIPEGAMGNLFNDFYTSGKKGGTGLGLAFCRRNMRAFGGDIICESKFGNGKNGWTKFTLLFNILSDEELDAAQKLIEANNDNQRGRILIVDDERTNLMLTKKKVEKAINVVKIAETIGGITSIVPSMAALIFDFPKS